MRKIYKYILEVVDEVQEHQISFRAEECHVDLNPADESQLAIWFVVDDDDSLVTRKFFVRGTGQSIPKSAYHMGSVRSGMFMWHVFEVRP